MNFSFHYEFERKNCVKKTRTFDFEKGIGLLSPVYPVDNTDSPPLTRGLCLFVCLYVRQNNVRKKK